MGLGKESFARSLSLYKSCASVDRRNGYHIRFYRYKNEKGKRWSIFVSQQRTAVPTLFAFLDKNNELFFVAFRTGNIEIIEVPDILILGILRITDIQRDTCGRNTKLHKNLFQRRTHLVSGFLNTGSINRKFKD